MKSFKQFLEEGKKARERERLIGAHRLAANTVATEILVPNRPNLTPQQVMQMSGEKAVLKDVAAREKRMRKGIKAIMKQNKTH